MIDFLKKAFQGFSKKVEEEQGEKEEKEKEKNKAEPVKVVEPVKKGFFKEIEKFVIETKLSEENFGKMFSELEDALLKNNVAIDVVSGIKTALKWNIVEKPVKREDVNKIVKDSLKEFVAKIFQDAGQIDLLSKVRNKKPFVILFIGVNGVGKTTTLAKIAKYLQKNNLSCVFGAADTFRAASIEQLEEHANKLGIHVVKHNYGADAAAVAYDAITHAKAQGINTVLIDTAGRSHTNADLMDELAKVRRVAKPDMVILTVDSLTGNDAAEQAKLFEDKIGFDAFILTKTDTDEKGGAIISVSYTVKKPILFLGVGQRYEDLKPFKAEEIINKLFG